MLIDPNLIGAAILPTGSARAAELGIAGYVCHLAAAGFDPGTGRAWFLARCGPSLVTLGEGDFFLADLPGSPLPAPRPAPPPAPSIPGFIPG